eukprot:CAMPEP_0175139236 /NCGR_PEP_ID=MMETSP0087-20121206/10787_1 /TAXON_ID=136419 /ORGANISM="Unknown Unknown, Strain D1" /LENGTH=226 /DNA_ID=CAMNT_0016422217 /DNA_START=83 /DNA_END=763 /DNA_ORIENTATION=+
MTQCSGILKTLQSKSEAVPFLTPVDWEYYGLTDYPEIIKNPMDLGTIQERLEGGKYAGSEPFAADVRLVWKNAQKYNRPDSDIYVTADKLSKLFEKRFLKVKKTGGDPNAEAAPPPAAATPTDNKRRRPTTPSSNAAPAASVAANKQATDRVTFSNLVNQLTPEELGQIVDRIHREAPDALNDEDDDELEIEINAIPISLLQSLNAFASKCAANNANNNNKKRKVA